MFTKTASYYDALYEVKDYSLACSELQDLVTKINPGARTLLDVGCGTGKHLAFLQQAYVAEGLDLNAGLLGIARERCPSVTFHEADMTAFSLGKTFDVVVSLFSSIGYVKTVANLNKAVRAMTDHLAAGGLLLIEPWIYPENYWVDRLTANFVDKPDLKIAWMYKSRLDQLTSVFDIHYMVASPEGISTFEEKHTMGLWTDAEYRQAFMQAGISPTYDQKGFFGRGMYYGLKNS
ncbi:MAG: class I SAM-dependent methyltransferase [Chitinophagaceae bacterium]